MSAELPESWKPVLEYMANCVSGSARRELYARVVRALGRGGQRLAQKELGWSRTTVRKGEHELQTGMVCQDGCNQRGAKPVETRLPNLRADIKAIVEEQSQTDPTFETTRIFRRLTAAEVRKQLISTKGYSDEELPSEEVIRKRLNLMGFRPAKIRKTVPKKKIPQTDAIFDHIHAVNAEATTENGELRLSIDPKARVKVGAFARGGRSRSHTAALDHDYEPDAVVTPVGILVPEFDELYIAIVESKVTSDCIVDILDHWWTINRARFVGIHTLVLNLDNGPENNSRRTQFIKRIVEFVDSHAINVRLAYYPPYHSKYNPIERCWGVLENYWNGSLLNTVRAVIGMAQGMTWKRNHPTVDVVTQSYEAGVKLTNKAMAALESRLERLPGLEKWSVDIAPQAIPV